MMEEVIKRGTGWNAKIGRPAAGKTGTTDDFVDAWFIGFTPDLVTAVYIGNDDRKPLGNKMTGGVVAAPIWAKFMKNALENNEKKDFLQPDKITKISVCKESGLLPTDSCPEQFIRNILKYQKKHQKQKNIQKLRDLITKKLKKLRKNTKKNPQKLKKRKKPFSL
ncbi:hypothetical protein ES705_50553 [subsurface metagenome]